MSKNNQDQERKHIPAPSDTTSSSLLKGVAMAEKQKSLLQWTVTHDYMVGCPYRCVSRNQHYGLWRYRYDRHLINLYGLLLYYVNGPEYSNFVRFVYQSSRDYIGSNEEKETQTKMVMSESLDGYLVDVYYNLINYTIDQGVDLLDQTTSDKFILFIRTTK
jgi:hypothetical protein